MGLAFLAIWCAYIAMSYIFDDIKRITKVNKKNCEGSGRARFTEKKRDRSQFSCYVEIQKRHSKAD
jgi:hypothetical protein